MDDHWTNFHRLNLEGNPQRIPPSMDGPDYYCTTCLGHYEGKISFVYHLKNVHQIRYRSHQKMDVTPDIMDPNHRCAPCCKTFKARPLYRNHLRVKHGITVSSETANLHANTKPDLFNKNNFCIACQKYFVNRNSYLIHLHYSYGIDVEPYKKHRSQVAVDQYNKRNNKIDIPDLNDPFMYCATCCRSYETKLKFQNHLRMIHNVYAKPSKGFTKNTMDEPLDIEPDRNNPDNHCTSCRCTFKSTESFQSHLKYSHPLPPSIDK